MASAKKNAGLTVSDIGQILNQIKSMTISDLIKYAEESHIELANGANKNTLINTILTVVLSEAKASDVRYAVPSAAKCRDTASKATAISAIADLFTGEHYKPYSQKEANSTVQRELKEILTCFSENADSFSGIKEKSKAHILKYIESVPVPSDKSKNEILTDISTSSEHLKTYLSYLSRMESDIYFLSEQCTVFHALKELCDKKLKEVESLLKGKLFPSLELQHIHLKTKVDELTHRIESPQYYIDLTAIVEDHSDKLKPPRKPRAPSMQPSKKPAEPVYRKANLFNRKKVEAENAILKQQYQDALEQYEQDLIAYNNAQEQYKNKLKKYNKDLLEYDERCRQHHQDAQRKACESIKISALEELVQAEKALADFEAEETKFKKVFIVNALSPLTQLFAWISDSLNTAQKNLLDLLRTKNELLSYNIVYGKYRNLIAITALYEYVDSGRCSSLEGPHGAYSLYESEVRTDEIISQLTNISTSLDEIKENQYLLYTELKQINNNLSTINSTIKDVMQNVIKELSSIHSQVAMTNYKLSGLSQTAETIAANTKATMKNTAATAYYSAITAHYSKMTATCTNALAFIAAMK